MTSIFIHRMPEKASAQECGQAVGEYAFLLGMLLMLVGLMTLVGQHIEHGLSWVASTIH